MSKLSAVVVLVFIVAEVAVTKLSEEVLLLLSLLLLLLLFVVEEEVGVDGDGTSLIVFVLSVRLWAEIVFDGELSLEDVCDDGNLTGIVS